MDDEVTANGTTVIRQADTLVRETGVLVGRLAHLLANTEARSTGLEFQSPAADARVGPGTAYQQALLWTYALFLAHCPHVSHSEGGQVYNSRHPQRLPRTNLQRQLAQLQEAGQRRTDVAQIVGALDRLFSTTNMEKVLREIDSSGDAWRAPVDFLEILLAGSDPALRRRRGVYFTPYPLVQYIVRSVDLLLRRDLRIEGGLVARRPDLRIVDPACGSGAFLLGVLEHAHQTWLAREEPDTWEDFLRQTFADRLAGADIMPACCGAVEMLVQYRLANNSQAIDSQSRTVTAPSELAWSAHCGSLLEDVEYSRQLFAGRLPVILGNPPYSNFGRHNRGRWILDQLNVYKVGLKEKKLNLDDDYIKFLRWSQYWVNRAKQGVVALVTNNTYLAGITHRQMRTSLSETFDHVYVLDLHGNLKSRETAPDGSRDENVFPIQQGVAIGLFVKTGRGTAGKGRVEYGELWGSREAKLDALSNVDAGQVNSIRLKPREPFLFFVPRRDEHAQIYQRWPRLNDVFQQYVSGVQTKRDALFVGYTRNEVASRLAAFLQDAGAGHFAPEIPQWLRRRARHAKFDARLIRRYMVAPLDMRWVYYDPRLLGRARYHLLQYLDAGNIALVFMRQATNPKQYDHFLITNVLASDRVFYSAHGAPFVAPLYARHDGRPEVNLDPHFVRQLAGRVGLPFTEGEGGSSNGFDSRDVLHWLYAAVCTRSYRQRYHSLLCVDFPRVPWPDSPEHFRRLSRAGAALVQSQLNLFSAGRLAAGDTATRQRRKAREECVTIPAGFPVWRGGQLALNADFNWPQPVEGDVWDFRIGGYPVLARWLRQRRHRALLEPDLDYLARMIQAIRETLRIVAQLE